MSKKKHHNLSLKLLAGRSLPGGVPWSQNEERSLISEERALWEGLSESDREDEQKFLIDLWNQKTNRQIEVSSEWGKWAEGIQSIKIPDSAFGVSKQNYRPYPKGLPLNDYPEFSRIVSWLCDRGFQVIEVEDGVIIIAVSNPRSIQESERLYQLLVSSFPAMSLQPYGSGEGTQIKTIYDPVSGQALIELSGITDQVLD